MPIQIWLFSALVASSVPILWWGLTGSKTVSVKALNNLGDRRPSDLRTIRLEQPPVERILLPVFKHLGSVAHRFTPTNWIQRYERSLGEAGKLGTWTPEQVIGAKVFLTILATLWSTIRVLGEPTSNTTALAVVVIGLAFFLPDLLLSSTASRRKEEIELELPDVLDQLTMSVEAGLGFEAAISRIANQQNHVLAQEFGRLMQDIQLGTPRSVALEALSKRSGVEDLRHVVLSLRQAEKLGVPLAQTLRVMSDQMRQKRAFRAEEKAHKLPIKIIFPLGFCILPALFVVILGPAIIQLIDVF